MKKNIKCIDEYLPIAFLYALSAYFVIDTEDFTKASLMYPNGLVWILLALTTLLLALTLAKKVKLPVSKDENVRFKLGVILTSSTLYVFAVAFLGFVISSLIFCPVTAILLGYRRKGILFTVTVITVGVIYFAFKIILKVPLPTIGTFGITL